MKIILIKDPYLAPVLQKELGDEAKIYVSDSGDKAIESFEI